MKWNISAIEHAFAAAAMDSERWNEAMEVLVRTIDCKGAGLVPVHSKFPEMPHSEDVAELAHEYLHGRWQGLDPRYLGLPDLHRIGVTSDLNFLTLEQIRKNSYYQDFLVRFDCPWFAGLRFAAGDDFRCLTLQRSAAHGPFSNDELGELRLLSNSLSSTAQLAFALNSAKANAALASFEASQRPLILLNARGEPSLLNHSAERLLGRDIWLSEGRLISWSRQATSELERALHALLLKDPPAGSALPVSLPRTAPGKRPIIAYPVRIPGVTSDAFGAARAAIVLDDLDARPTVPGMVMKAVFRLTPMEVKVAQALLAGLSLEVASDELGVSKETGRAHLKAVFAKTQTSRQGELVALLGRLCP